MGPNYDITFRKLHAHYCVFHTDVYQLHIFGFVIICLRSLFSPFFIVTIGWDIVARFSQELSPTFRFLLL